MMANAIIAALMHYYNLHIITDSIPLFIKIWLRCYHVKKVNGATIAIALLGHYNILSAT